MRRAVPPLAAAVVGLLLLGLVALPAANGQPAIEIHAVHEGHFLPLPGQPVFFAAIGSDTRAGLGGSRGDALHLIGVNPAARAATILNIPRDTFVEIPGRGRRKINDALSIGGPQAQAQALERLTGIRPHFVLTTTFVGFSAMTDELGGVEVDVDIPMNDRFSGAVFPRGRVHMDGRAALAFARNRHIPGGDFRRTHNQGVLILAALTKLRAEQAGPAGTLRYLAVLGRHTRIEGVGLADLYRLGRLGLSVDPANVRNVTMPGSTGSAGGASVVFPAGGAGALFADMRDDAVLQAH